MNSPDNPAYQPPEGTPESGQLDRGELIERMCQLDRFKFGVDGERFADVIGDGEHLLDELDHMTTEALNKFLERELELEKLSNQRSGVEGEVSEREWARLMDSVPDSEKGILIGHAETATRTIAEEDEAIRTAVEARDAINPLRHPIEYRRAQQQVRREFSDWN